MISAEVTPEDAADFGLSGSRVGRFLASPAVLTAFVIIMGLGTLAFGVLHHHATNDDASPLPQTSIPAGSSNNLSVQPLAQSTGTGAAANTSLQSAAGGSTPDSDTPSTADAQLGAGSTTSLGGGSSAGYQSTAGGLDQFSGQSLTP